MVKNNEDVNEVDQDYKEEVKLLMGDVPPTPKPSVERLFPQVCRQADLFSITQYETPRNNWKEFIRKQFRCDPLTCLFRTIPLLHWLPKYSWKKNILFDILSGITVAIMHIPQGMAYGILGNVPAVVGLYMAVVPVIVYTIFGTSRHVSMGTFAIVCMMTGKTVYAHGGEAQMIPSVDNSSSTMAEQLYYTNLEIATTVTITVSFILFIMFTFRLGIIANLLSETLVNSFTCACAFHVVGSQLKDLFGFKLAKRQGAFSLPFTIYDAVLAVPRANRAAVSISLVAIVLTVLNNEILKPVLAKKTRIPFPIELVAVAVGTLTSYLCNFQENYGIGIVGEIPTGLPPVSIPVFSLIPTLLYDSLIIALISYTIAMSMGLIFANKDHYEIDANQELFAMGLANLAGSMFSCLPISASLSRSTIQYTVGGVTQIASIVSSFIIIVVLLWIAPVFKFLPRAVLASIIVVALSSMLQQFLRLPIFWKMNKWDGLIWLVTFLTTCIVAIDIGLGAGLAVSILSLLFQGQIPYTCLLGAVPNTDLYLDINRFKGAEEIPGIKIFHYAGSLNFASKLMFKNILFKTIGFKSIQKEVNKNEVDDGDNNSLVETKCVIIDCSALTYIDPVGVEQLRIVYEILRSSGIELYIAACSGPVYETFMNCNKCNNAKTPIQIFPRIQDAVMYEKLLIYKTASDT